jgi:hypothetical protein
MNKHLNAFPHQLFFLSLRVKPLPFVDQSPIVEAISRTTELSPFHVFQNLNSGASIHLSLGRSLFNTHLKNAETNVNLCLLPPHFHVISFLTTPGL